MKKDSENRRILRAMALLTQLGISMAACVFVGVLLGRFLDRLLGTSPWLLVVFAFIGAGAAFKVLYDMAMKEWMNR